MKPLLTYFLRLPPTLGRRLLPYLRRLNMMRNLEMGIVMPHLEDPRGLMVLDAGCHQSVYPLFLVDRGAYLVGMDISSLQIARAREVTSKLGLNEKTQHLVASVSEIPFGEGSFDVVLCNCVLEHVVEDERAMEEIYRVLKPGGKFLLTVECEERGFFLRSLSRLPKGVKALFLKGEIASASTFEDGLRKHLDGVYGVLRRYSGPELVNYLHSLGFQVLESCYYLTCMGAFLFESLHSLRGIDITTGIGRLAFLLISLLSVPLLALLGDISSTPGHGLGIVAVKRP